MAEDNQGRRITFLKDALNKLAKAVSRVSNGLIDLEGVINRITGKTRDFAKNQQQVAQTMSRVSKNIKQTSTEIDRYSKKTDTASRSSKGFFGNIGKNLKTIVSFYGAYQVLNLAISAFTELTFGSAKRAIALEKALADLRAVAGLTTEDISRLEKVVFDVAGVTSLTSLEVVELQKQLAKLGSSVDEIENLTRPVALLSQALGEEPGGVAAVLKKTLNQFQATADEADKFANILTGAVNETALSMNDLGTALGYVGPLGAQLGVSFEETAALLGILADNGFKASKAGTGLRSFFIAAAKDGRPFNEFLEEVGNKNLQAAESVDIFGKVAASQSLVLSQNVQRYKELSEELKESNRLFEANAVQMGSTEGQLQLLRSAYDKFSTALGEVVTKTNLFINLTKFLSPETAAQAKAFQILSQASEGTKGSFEDLTKSLVGFGSNTRTSALMAQSSLRDFLVSSGTITEEQGDMLVKRYLKFGKTISDYYEGTGTQAELAIRGVLDLAEQRASTLRDEKISQAAVNDEYEAAREELSKLQSVAAKGNLTEERREEVLKRVQKSLKDVTEAYDESTDVDQRKVLEKRIALYEEIETSLKNLDNSEEALKAKEDKRLKELEKVRKENFDKELDRIKSELEAEIDRVKAVTDVELEGAKNAEEAAQIRLKQEKLVQSAYNNSANQVEGLKDKYPEFIEQIEKVSESYDKFSRFTQSDIGKEGINILNDYKKQFEDLGKELQNGKIKLGDYQKKEDELEASLISSITTLKNNTGANQELKDMLDKIVVAFLAAKKGAEEYAEGAKKSKDSTDKAKRSFKDWKDELKDTGWVDIVRKAVDATGDVLSEFNDTQLQNTTNRLNQELDAIDNRYRIEGDILRSQLDNQLITESQFRAKQIELRKQQVRDENDVNKKIFEAQKKEDRQNAIIEGAEAAAQAYLEAFKAYEPLTALGVGSIGAAIAAAQASAQVSAINQRKFFPKKFEDGGIVSGPSHADGGVPFTVQGQSGYEMEGGEFIVNKKATAMHRDLLERINNSYRTNPTQGQLKFAQGGFVRGAADESVNYLKAIAEATTSTAIGVRKPVRAFVADKDLRTNASERRIRDRNDRI